MSDHLKTKLMWLIEDLEKHIDNMKDVVRKARRAINDDDGPANGLWKTYSRAYKQYRWVLENMPDPAGPLTYQNIYAYLVNAKEEGTLPENLGDAIAPNSNSFEHYVQAAKRGQKRRKPRTRRQ